MDVQNTRLVLSRKAGQSIEIQGEKETVIVTVEAIAGRQVRLSFEAPKCIGIWRQEILDDEDHEEVRQR